MSAKRKPCNCLKQVQDQLAERNCHIVIEHIVKLSTGAYRNSPPSLRVAKINSRKRTRLPVIFASYCPFCGQKYAT